LQQDPPFHRHRGPITAATWVPATRKIMTSGYDGAVARYDVDSGAVELFGHHDHLVNRVVVDPAGRRAASVSSDYTVHLWDLAAARRERVLWGHSDDVEDFCFIEDQLGASVSRDRRILVWNLATGAIVRVLAGHDKDVLSVCSHAGRLYTSGDDSTLRVWDLQTGRQLRSWGPFATETDTCAVDPVRGRAVLGCDDGCIRVFDLETGAEAVIEAHRSGIKKVACSPLDGAIVSAAYDQEIHVWDGQDFSRRLSLERRATKWERSFNWSPDGRHIVAGTFDGTVLVWRAADGRCLGELGARADQPGNDCFNDVSTDGRGTVALVNDAGHVRMGRLVDDEARWLCTVAPASGRMLMNAVDFDGGTVVGGAHDQRLHVFDWDDQDLRERAEVHLGEGPINCVRTAHHAGWEGVLFVACYSGAIARVAPDGRVLGSFRLHDNAVKALRLHPTRPFGVSCSADGVLAAWTLTGELMRAFPGHTAIIDDVDIDPEGGLVASTGRDFHLKVYRLDDGLLLHSIELGRRSPKALCFLDAHTVVVTNYWGELLRVDLSAGRVLRRAIARNGISAVCRVGTAGEHVIAASYDGAAYLVRTADLAVVRELRAMQQRPEVHA
jgi:WD40 repeat protein